ncbi:FadR/GntR family transcriptional regulator [Paucidesulfovibrio longus]|uniref:FadR/GntR family transcriptional regulator n=1 Tax=Paucidesulfovibrio longus TaxID=889 RepID=UPI0003B54B1C|nr:GntR family transcriptional regulator [Paucidesulfovibrio longus]
MNESKTDLLFLPARSGRASEDVALQIEAAIVGGRIAPGASLPSERVLQEQFGTGRGVIREAISALRQKGLLEVRKGAKGGAYVKQMEVSNVSESLALFLRQNHVGTQDLIEFRESVDRTITMLALTRAPQEAKDALVAGAEALEREVKCENPDFARVGEMDRELNIMLATMAGNPIFEWIMRAVQLGFSSHDYALYEDAGYAEKTVANWTETARAIAAADPLRALNSIGFHYALLRRRVQEREGERPAGKAFLGAKNAE